MSPLNPIADCNISLTIMNELMKMHLMQVCESRTKFRISKVYGCTLSDFNVQLWYNVQSATFLCTSVSFKLVTKRNTTLNFNNKYGIGATHLYAKKCNTVLWTPIRSFTLSRIHWRWVTENWEKSDRQQPVPRRGARGASKSIFYAKAVLLIGGCKNS